MPILQYMKNIEDLNKVTWNLEIVEKNVVKSVQRKKMDLFSKFSFLVHNYKAYLLSELLKLRYVYNIYNLCNQTNEISKTKTKHFFPSRLFW